MDSSTAALSILARWLHIASAAALLGGFLFFRFVAWPAGEPGNEDVRTQALERLRLRFRPLLFTALALLVLSGAYNFLGKLEAGRNYHIWFGIKLIFVLHILGVSLLLGSVPVPEAKRSRLTAGIVVSGAVVLAISAYLRWLGMR